MKTRRILTILAVLVLLCIPGNAVLADDGFTAPDLPEAFYGDILIDGEPAPPGTVIEVRGEGVNTDANNNILVTTEFGQFGELGANLLVVQGYIPDGTVLTFFVNGIEVATPEPVIWESGTVTELDLELDTSASGQSSPPASGSSGETGGSSTGGNSQTTAQNVVELSLTAKYDASNLIANTVSLTAGDGKARLEIPAGTSVRDKLGNPLSSIKVQPARTPQAAPAGSTIIGQVYDFSPDGATFEPYVTLELTYTAADIPEGSDEQDLKLAFYNISTGEWEIIASLAIDGKILAPVEHFCQFAILVQKELSVSSTEPEDLSNLTMPAKPVSPDNEPGEVSPEPAPQSESSSDQGNTGSPAQSGSASAGENDVSGKSVWPLIGIAGGGLVAIIIVIMVIRRIRGAGY